MGTVKVKIPQMSPKGLTYRVVEVDEELAKKQLAKPNLSRNSGFRNASLYEEPKTVEVKKAETPTLFEKTKNVDTSENVDSKKEEPKTTQPKKKRK